MVRLISYVKSVVYLHLSEWGLLFVNVFLLEKKIEGMSADDRTEVSNGFVQNGIGYCARLIAYRPSG